MTLVQELDDGQTRDTNDCLRNGDGVLGLCDETPTLF